MDFRARHARGKFIHADMAVTHECLGITPLLTQIFQTTQDFSFDVGEVVYANSLVHFGIKMQGLIEHFTSADI